MKDVGDNGSLYLQHFDGPWLNTVRLTGYDLDGAGANQYSVARGVGHVEHVPYRLSMILTSAPAIASALAHITPAGPAPMIKTSTRLSRGMANGVGEGKRALGAHSLRSLVYGRWPFLSGALIITEQFRNTYQIVSTSRGHTMMNERLDINGETVLHVSENLW